MSKVEITFDRACSVVETALNGTARHAILTDASTSTAFGEALRRLGDSMRANVLKAGAHKINLATIIAKYDNDARQDGFHVLHDWDGKADKVTEDTIPVDVLNYLIDKRGGEQPDTKALAILLDYYFLYVLALLSLRIWDHGSADNNLDRVNQLLHDLQGQNGSGQQFAADAGTLMLIATSHFELADRAYDTLLDKVRALNPSHRTAIAFVHAASLGSHLRFGFEATYGRDTAALRSDNTVDYRWLCFALAILMRQYSRLHDERIQGIERERVVEAMLNGLSPDARAFVGDPPTSLSACEAERAEFYELFHKYRQDLLEEFERHRPSDHSYSPLSFFFNFSHNILKGIVVDALLRGRAWNLTLNDLLTGIPRGEAAGEGPREGPGEGPGEGKDESKQLLARTLMGYARSSPDTIRGCLMPVIIYDPRSGHRAFALTMRKITE